MEAHHPRAFVDGKVKPKRLELPSLTEESEEDLELRGLPPDKAKDPKFNLASRHLWDLGGDDPKSSPNPSPRSAWGEETTDVYNPGLEGDPVDGDNISPIYEQDSGNSKASLIS